MPSSPTSDAARPPGFADVAAAAARLRGHAVLTPLLESEALNRRVGGRLLIKAETLQRTGSFKFRGAWNRIAQLTEAERRRGVLAYSSGNHAQAVAAAARRLEVAATIVMPADAPAVKLESTRAFGPELLLYDPATESREAIATERAAATGAVLVPPYDDARVIAGQGTAGLEIAVQAAACGATLDAVLAPCGGGGLIAGCALALKEKLPGVEIHPVEPEGYDDTARSLASGRRETAAAGAATFCDALRAPTPGALTFAVNARLLAAGLAVGDAETAAAMSAAFRWLKLVVEPGGAVALAAALAGRIDCRGRTVAVLCSGGNVDPDTFGRAIGLGNARSPG